jgi:rfaE bifunctional protein kinase chain/domain
VSAVRPAGELLTLLPGLRDRRVLVVGDLCLDTYVVGRSARLSREAPVPVLEYEREWSLPGAAANPALNVCSLGGRALAVGVVGDDAAGETLRACLIEAGVDTRGVLVETGRQTTVKTRLLAEVSLRFPQQVARIDRLDRRPLAVGTHGRLAEAVRALAAEADAVLLSDYKGGVAGEDVVAAARDLARGMLVTVDSQGDPEKFAGCTVVRSNLEEAEAALRRPLREEGALIAALGALVERLGSRAVLVTRSAEGMVLVEADGAATTVPAANRTEVYDVTGAGDTVIAAFTLAAAGGAAFPLAAQLASVAAGLVVRRLGNATPTAAEIREALQGSA